MDTNSLLNIAIVVGIVAAAVFFILKSKGKVGAPAAPSIMTATSADHLAAVTTAISNAVVATAQAIQAPAAAAPAPAPSAPVTAAPPPAPAAAPQVALWPEDGITLLPWDRITTLEVPIGNTQKFAVNVPAGARFTAHLTIAPSNVSNYAAGYDALLEIPGVVLAKQHMLGAGGDQTLADMGAGDQFPRVEGPCLVTFTVASSSLGGSYLLQFQQTARA